MYSSVDNILMSLPPFQNEKQVIIYDQSAGDIINAIVSSFKKNKNEYDKIFSFFAGNNEVETAENVFNFLKKNVRYVIEDEDNQLIKTPAAIIATGKTGSDCKNYALFIAGVMDAYRRNEGVDFPLSFRFASYKNDKTPQHVFVVLYPGSNEEIWIDPVLNYFDQKVYPYYFKDKKITNMALSSLGGIGLDYPSAPQDISTIQQPAISQSSMQQGGSLLSSFQNIFNSSTTQQSTENVAVNTAAAVASGDYLTAALNVAKSVFKNAFTTSWAENWNKLKNLPADQVLAYYIHGVQSGQLDHGYLNQYSELFGNKATSDPKFGINHVAELHYDVAKAYNDLYKQVFPNDPSINQNLIDLTKTIQPSIFQSLIPGGAATPGTSKAGMSTFIIVALLGAGLYMFTKKQK